MRALISLLLPTRGRPRLAERFLQSALSQAADPSGLEAILYTDDDDAESHALGCAGLKCETIVGPRATMGYCNTACLARSSGDIVVLTNDDVVVRTPAWDRRLRELHESVPDGIYLAYPNDLFKGRRLCTFPVLSRRLCNLLADPFPQAYAGAFIDYHLLDIFKRLEHLGFARQFYLEQVLFEHMHYRTGKSPYDETYRQRARFGDDGTFLALRDARNAAAARLAGVILDGRRGGQDPGVPAPCRGTAQGKAWGVRDVARCTLMDRKLPLRWRWRLGIWMLARLIAIRRWLPGTGRGTRAG